MATTYEYEKPQVKVFQTFTEVPTASVGNQPVLVFGSSYELYRYDNDKERELTRVTNKTGSDWAASGTLELASPRAGNDTGWALKKLFAEDAFVQIGQASIQLVAAADVKIGQYVVDEMGTYAYLVASDFSGTDIDLQVGDYIYASGEFAKRAQVLAIYTNTDVHTRDTYPLVAKLDSKAIVDAVGDMISGVSGTVDLSDNDSPESVYVAIHRDSVEITTGLTFKDAGVEVDMGAARADEPRSAAGGILEKINGDFFIQHRVRRTDLAGSIESVDSIPAIATLLGDIDPDNPLAYGAFMAKLNSGSCPVYYVATTADDKAAYSEVLRKASLTEDIYQLCPLTQDPEILDLVQGHITEMSQPEVKRWRIGWVSPSFATSKNFLRAKRVKGTNASVELAFVDAQGNYDTSVKALTDIAPNDQIYVGGEAKYTVKRVIDNQRVELTQALTATVPSETIDYVAHTYTGSELAQTVASTSRGFSDMRMYSVFPSTLHQTIDGEEREVAGYFGAAAVAGLCSSTLPQQPLTNMTITGIYDVPETYSRFSNAELNVMAAGGTFIIAQDLPYDKVYVRHQLSTATSEGNLLTRELSIVKNVDSISYYLAETCDDLIGKYNITPELIRVIELRLQTALDYLENNVEGGLYGPQLLDEGTEIVSVAEHPTLKDHVQAYIRLNPPKPFNVLEIYLTVI